MAMSIFKSVLLDNYLIVLTLTFLPIIAILIFYLVKETQSTSILKKELIHLKEQIQELDQQAKLIIKSDMEVKLYQQKIESELNKLALIKKLIISSIHILDREKLFSQINENVINNLGFKKGLILGFDNLDIKVNVNFATHEIQAIKNIFGYKKELLKEVRLLSPNSEIYKQLLHNLQTKKILAAPIKVKEYTYAIFIVSHSLLHTEIKKPEKEAFLIICMHFSRCLDNIGLFEDIYHTKDNLEKKIKERTNELVKSLRAIENINKTKSDFISSVSHELRTPLTSVKGFSSLLVDEKFGKLPEEAKKRLTKIDENVNKLVNIVNTLLDISRIESGKMETKIAPFELAKVIRDTADFLIPQIESKGLNLSLDIPENLNVYMDKNLIERVLFNLINNAIKFTPETGAIKIKCKQVGKQAVISVSDTGYGMKKDDTERVFREFFRVNNPANTKIEGSGLGLSLVKRIIDTHKEKIWVESELNKGTTFYFTLKVT